MDRDEMIRRRDALQKALNGPGGLSPYWAEERANNAAQALSDPEEAARGTETVLREVLRSHSGHRRPVGLDLVVPPHVFKDAVRAWDEG